MPPLVLHYEAHGRWLRHPFNRQEHSDHGDIYHAYCGRQIGGWLAELGHAGFDAADQGGTDGAHVHRGKSREDGLKIV